MSAAALAAKLTADGIAQAVLLEAVALGRFGLIGIDDPDDRLTAATLKALGEPYLVTIAANYGPGRTRCAPVVRSWARFSVVHAVVEHETEYRIIAQLAELHGRVLLIETTASLAAAWLTFLRDGPPFMGLLPGRPPLRSCGRP